MLCRRRAWNKPRENDALEGRRRRAWRLGVRRAEDMMPGMGCVLSSRMLEGLAIKPKRVHKLVAVSSQSRAPRPTLEISEQSI